MLRVFGHRRKDADPLAALEGPLELARRPDETGRSALAGRHRGVPLELWLEGRELMLTAEVEAELPPGLNLTREDDAQAAASRDLTVADPELDALLRIDASAPAAAIRLLRTKSLRAPLIAFFSRPKAALSGSTLWVTLEETADVATVREAARAAAVLAEALVRAARELAQAHAAEQESARSGESKLDAARRFVRIASEESESLRIRREHRMLRSRVLRFAVLPGSVGAALSAIAFDTWMLNVHRYPDLRMSGFLLGLGAAVFSAIGTYWFYCCPACDRRLITPLAPLLMFAPRTCPHCGAQLR